MSLLCVQQAKKIAKSQTIEFELEDMDILFGSFVFQVMRRCRPRKS